MCKILVWSNLSYMTFQGNKEIWSHKASGHLIDVVNKVGLAVVIKHIHVHDNGSNI